MFYTFQKEMLDLESAIHTIDRLVNDELEHLSPVSLLDVMYKKLTLYEGLIQNLEYFKLKNLLPNTIWSSLFVTGYSILEHTLDDLCLVVQTEQSLKLGPRDLKHRGIIRSEVYLASVSGCIFPSQGAEWKAITQANLVRNCLSHASGILDDSLNREELTKLLTTESSLSTSDGRLILSKDYVSTFVNNTKTMLSQLTGIQL